MDWLNILKSLLLYSSLSSFRPHPFCSFGSSLYLFSPEAFHFLYVWTTHDNFQRIIIDSWTTPIAPSPPMSILMQKLKWLKGALHSWNISTFGNLDHNIDYQEAKLEEIQTLLSNLGFTKAKFDKEIAINNELDVAISRKDLFIKEKATVRQLKYGDRNLKSFIRLSKSRERRAWFLLCN